MPNSRAFCEHLTVLCRGKLVGLLPAVLVSLLWGCDRGLPDVSSEEGDRVAEIAKPAADDLLRTLVGRLTEAMSENGAAGAVAFCSDQAIALTQAAQEASSTPIRLKRTSFRYRNPDNAPDQAEEEALLFFEESLQAGGEMPPGYVQRVSDEEFRYYRPLFIGEMCLQCHGDPAEMDPDVVRILSERYPADLATGYSLGAFRGVVRVSVPSDAISP